METAVENAFFQQLSEELEDHVWSFQTDTLSEYLEAQAREKALFEKSLKNSLPGVQLYIKTQLAAISAMCEKSVAKERSVLIASTHRAVHDALDTGDTLYDAFRARCNRHNWNWRTNLDPNEQTAGQREEEAIELEVMVSKDPKYRAYYTYAKAKYTN